MTKCASPVGCAASSSVSTLTPANQVSNFDHVVTQWIAPRYSDAGSLCASSQVQVVGLATLPSTLMLQVSGAIRGVGSAVSTGQSPPTSYCPGGSRGSLAVRRRPRKPRVGPGTSCPLCPALSEHSTGSRTIFPYTGHRCLQQGPGNTCDRCLVGADEGHPGEGALT